LGRVSNEDMEAKALTLLSMWLDQENQEDTWVYYADLKDEAIRVKGFSKSALQRHLRWLVKTKKLEMIKDKKPETTKEGKTRKSRKTRYKPNKEYWQKTFRWIPIRREANDSEYIFFLNFIDEMTEKFDKTCQELVRKSDKPTPLGQMPTRSELDELNAQVAKLIRSIRLELSKEYFSEKREPEAVYALARKGVKRVISAYMDLWAFLALTHGARGVFSKQMGSLQRSVKRMKQKNP
jgi:hypothetical protein